MKKLILLFLISSVIYSCSKTESDTAVDKLSANDSMRLGLIPIGKIFQGGVVAYILQPGDPGYDVNIKHGLIAGTTDLLSATAGYGWEDGRSFVTEASGTAIGTGLTNTNKIIAKHGSIWKDYAAFLARSYTGGGYNDWYLPSKDELNKLYLNRIVIGNFNSQVYWSSTEYDLFRAWTHIFINPGGGQAFNNKNYPAQVRPVRSF